MSDKHINHFHEVLFVVKTEHNHVLRLDPFLSLFCIGKFRRLDWNLRKVPQPGHQSKKTGQIFPLKINNEVKILGGSDHPVEIDGYAADNEMTDFSRFDTFEKIEEIHSTILRDSLNNERHAFTTADAEGRQTALEFEILK